MSRRGRLAASLALSSVLLVATAAQAATQWTADLARSKLGFTGTLTGGSFDGTFGRFQPEITFDPADLAGSRFRVTIETSSADTRDGDRDAILKGAEFFAVERWPKATFEAAKFAAAGPGRYFCLRMGNCMFFLVLPFFPVVEAALMNMSLKSG